MTCGLIEFLIQLAMVFTLTQDRRLFLKIFNMIKENFILKSVYYLDKKSILGGIEWHFNTVLQLLFHHLPAISLQPWHG